MMFKNIPIVILLFSLAFVASATKAKPLASNHDSFYKKFDTHLFYPNGKPVKDSSKLHKRYVFIEYGADWCPHCMHFAAVLSSFYETYYPKYHDFIIIFYGTDHEKKQKDVNAYLTKNQLPFYAFSVKARGPKTVNSKMASCDFIPNLVLYDAHTGQQIASSCDKKGHYTDRMVAIKQYLKLHKDKTAQNFADWSETIPE